MAVRLLVCDAFVKARLTPRAKSPDYFGRPRPPPAFWDRHGRKGIDGPYMMSALERITDSSQTSRHVRFVPILLQKSAYRRRGTAGAFFEAIHCRPLDCAGDLRSTLLTLATLTQRTKGRTVVAGRPTWQACGGSAQSLPT